MGLTVAEKILKNHLVEGKTEKGAPVEIKIDQTLTQDATGTMVYLQFESMDIPRVKTEVSVSYIDHNTLQSDFRNMDDHRFLQTIAAKHGLYFSRPGNGICHQVHLERFGKPGKTLLGSDSHTPTGGGLGMIAIGAGGLDVAVAMAGGPFPLSYPEIIGVKLTGKLQPLCSAKDVILKLLQIETVKGGVGKIYEYFGDGVKSLNVTQRATITNMGAELGATTSVFPSDDITREFLKLQNREADWTEIVADSNAKYSRVIEIDLNKVEPMIATPHMPDKVVTVREVAGLPVDQVGIGSCTNSSINDLGAASEILDGKTVAANVSLGIAPGSKQVLYSAFEAGIMQKLIDAGARILESACGPCIGMGFAPKSGGVTLRTFNRNFKGRSGTPDAGVYLVSPETAAASALTGVITDPRDVFKTYTKDYSSFVKINDNMIVAPLSEDAAKEIIVEKGPNIKECPKASAITETIAAPILLKAGDNITTDDIMPAGSKVLPLRSNIPEISKYVYEAIDPNFHDKAKKAGKGIIIGGDNYGQGSSREHAALAPMYLGIKAIIAKSFARIHKANLINFGIMALEFANPADYDKINEGDDVEMIDVINSVKSGKNIVVRNNTQGFEFEVVHKIVGKDIDILLSGGKLNYTKNNF
ncbi:MAG: aconitate hydratase [Spirochaetales bacterium]|nr:aconitate hydratase [Spirochaetales bacterium]